MNKKILFSIILIFAFLFVGKAFAMTKEERQALIQQLTQEIALLQAKLELMQSSSTNSTTQSQSGSTWCYDFSVTLKMGDTGVEVTALQKALIKEGLFAGYSSPTGYFGINTYYAVVAFQEKYSQSILVPYGLNKGTGRVAGSTKAKLNALYGCASNDNGDNANDTISCISNWSCGNWTSCVSGQQTRSCTDLNNCGISPDSSLTFQTCSSTCSPNWSCGNWGDCTNGLQTKTCTDLNNCGVTANKPSTAQICYSNTNDSSGTCSPNWSCTSWGVCSVGGTQSRICNDLNSCGVATGKPAETQTCSNYNIGNSVPDLCNTDWVCGDWSECDANYQSRTCIDRNICGTTINKPSESQYCQMLPKVDLKAWVDHRADISDGPMLISNNTGVFLQWTSSNVDYCTASGGWSGSKYSSNSAGFLTPNVTSTTTYTITCSGPGGVATDSVVVNPIAFPAVDIKAEKMDGPVTVANGGAFQLSWSGANVNSCKLIPTQHCVGCNPDYQVDGAAESVDSHGVKTTSLVYLQLIPRYSYTLSCKDSSGNIIKDSVTTDISQLPAPKVTLLINGNPEVTMSVFGQVKLSWTSQNATDCVASGVWSGTKSLSGNETIALSKPDSEFSLTCTGPTGKAVSTVRVPAAQRKSGDRLNYAMPSCGTGKMCVKVDPSNLDTCLQCIDVVFPPTTWTTVCHNDSNCGTGWYCGCNFWDSKTSQYTCGKAPWYSPYTCMEKPAAITPVEPFCDFGSESCNDNTCLGFNGPHQISCYVMANKYSGNACYKECDAIGGKINPYSSVPMCEYKKIKECPSVN